MADAARMAFAGAECSDHMGLVRAYEAWQEAMGENRGREFCHENFLSFQTLQVHPPPLPSPPMCHQPTESRIPSQTPASSPEPPCSILL